MASGVGSVAPHYLAGLHEVPAEVPTLALALGHEFFVASSAIGASRLSRPGSDTARWSFRNLWNPAMLLVQSLVIWWPATWPGQLPMIWWPAAWLGRADGNWAQSGQPNGQAGRPAHVCD